MLRKSNFKLARAPFLELVMKRDFRGEIVQVEGVAGKRDDINGGYDSVKLAETLTRSTVRRALLQKCVGS